MRIEARLFSAALILLTIAFTPAFAQQPNEKMLHRRAVEAAIWGMPAVSMRSAINATRRDIGGDWNDIGGDWNDVVYFSKPMVSRHGFLTANNQVPYVISSINTKDGPMVVDVPPASEKTSISVHSSTRDNCRSRMWVRRATMKAKYLFLPPGYNDHVPDGYRVYRPATFSHPLIGR